jgi:hypothetical protein
MDTCEHFTLFLHTQHTFDVEVAKLLMTALDIVSPTKLQGVFSVAIGDHFNDAECRKNARLQVAENRGGLKSSSIIIFTCWIACMYNSIILLYRLL